MTITSTQFQQNVGKYLAMAEKGIPVVVERLKPNKSRFRITYEQKPKKGNRQSEKEYREWLKELQKFKLSYPDKDAVAYQRRMRS